MSLKAYILSIISISLIFLATTSYIWANPSQIAIMKHSFIKGSKYIIENDDGIYKAFNGETGELAYSGSNSTKVIQNTLDGLTSGRTWQETVILKGNFSVDDIGLPIKIPSYTRIDFTQSRITFEGDDKTKNLLENEDRTSGNEFIQIQGGFFDGVRGSTSYGDDEFLGYQSVGNAFIFEKVHRSTIADVKIKSFAGSGLVTLSCENNTYSHVVVEDCGGYGEIDDRGGKDSTYYKCKTTKSNAGGVYQPFGFYMAEDITTGARSQRIIFNDCEAWDHEWNYGFQIAGNFHRLTNCKSISNTGGFYLVVCKNSTLTDCIAYANEDYGIGLDICDAIHIKGGNAEVSKYGIGIWETSSDITISEVDVRHNSIKAIYWTNPIEDFIVYNCMGFATENSGTTGDLANGGIIPHGLAGKPNSVGLTCLNATYDGEPVLVYWDEPNSDSTNISVNIYWANGTAITDSLIDVSWYADYDP